MATKSFSGQEAVKFGWEVIKKKLGFFIVLMIITFLLVGLFALIGKIIEGHRAFNITYMIVDIIHIILSMGWLKITLKLYDNQEVCLSDLFSCVRLFFKYLISTAIYTLIVLAGIFLLIIPGIIWAIRFQFFTYFIIDKELRPIESLKKSWELTRGVAWKLIAFNCLVVLINLAGILALILGLFISIPVTALAYVFVYRKLLSQVNNAVVY